MTDFRFVARFLPAPPARILEIGCGPVGDLAATIAAAGYEVVAVDPVAPAGPIYRRIPFEAFDEPGPFDAVVASLSLHHIADLGRTAAAIAGLLSPGGRLILDEWDRERFLDDATARWYFHQREAAGALDPTRSTTSAGTYEAWRATWVAEHGGLHGHREMTEQLATHLREIFFTWRPYLYRYDLHPQLEPLERALIEEGAIRATGFRWVGERVAPSAGDGSGQPAGTRGGRVEHLGKG